MAQKAFPIKKAKTKKMGDIDVIKSIANVRETHEFSETVRFICNLAFEDHLNVGVNDKFPGSMVATLEKSQLKFWRGFPQCHVPYSATEIQSWLTPNVRVAPTVQAKPKMPVRLSFEVIRKPRHKQVTYSVLDTEFCGADGLFLGDECSNLVYFRNIEFAGQDGCFPDFVLELF